MDSFQLDWRITLAPVKQGNTGHVTLSFGEEPGEQVTETVDLSALEAFRRELLPLLADYIYHPVPPDLLRRIGFTLGAWLFPSRVRHLLEHALRRRTDHMPMVRLRLSVMQPELAGLPWEFACMSSSASEPLPHDYVGLHPCLRLVREVAPPMPVAPVSGEATRVLVACADPRSHLYGPLVQLDRERESVVHAFRSPECRPIMVRELTCATPDMLRSELERWRPHALHFIGHGEQRPTGGVLLLHDGRGGEAPVYADDLIAWLRKAAVRLVVLSACRTAGEQDSLAHILAEKGMPAVLAMQLPLRDATAGAFARAFYASLVEGQPVEEAVWQGRQVVQAAGPDWGVPALYLTAEHGKLFGDTTTAPRPIDETENHVVLPYRHNPDFTGRDGALEVLHAALMEDDPRPVALVGIGGLGKSQMAAEYALTHRADYPGGIFWVNGTTAERVIYDYAALGAFFSIPEQITAPQDRAYRVQQHLQSRTRPTLLIMDNVTEQTDLHLLPAFGPCRILFTAQRRNLVPYNSHILELSPLDEKSALALLRGAQALLPPEEERAARLISESLGGMPLALTLAAHHIRRRRMLYSAYLQQIEEDLEGTLSGLEPPVLPTEHTGRVFHAIDITHRGLPEAPRAVLALAACFAGRGISPVVLYEACEGLTRSRFEAALVDLEDACLLTCQEDNRWMMHALVRVYARDHLSAPALQGNIARVAAALTARLERANQAEDWREARPDMPHCHVAAELCREYEVTRAAYRLQREIGVYLFLHGETNAALRYLEEGLRTAELLSDCPLKEQAAFYMLIGQARQIRRDDRPALASARKALALARRAHGPDSPVCAEYYNTVGWVLRRQGRLRRAMAFYQKALEVNQGTSGVEDSETAVILNNIGTLYEAQGNRDSALRCLDRALAIDRAVSGACRPDIAALLNNTGRILAETGACAEALKRHQEARDIYEVAFGHRHADVAMSLYYMAVARHGMGALDEARQDAQAALAVMAELEGLQAISEGLCRFVREGFEKLGIASNE